MYDLSYLNSITDRDSYLIDTIINEFIDTVKADVEIMKKYISNNDSKKILEVLHRIKGSASIIGADKLIEILSDIEYMIMQKNKNSYLKCCDIFFEEIALIINNLDCKKNNILKI